MMIGGPVVAGTGSEVRDGRSGGRSGLPEGKNGLPVDSDVGKSMVSESRRSRGGCGAG